LFVTFVIQMPSTFLIQDRAGGNSAWHCVVAAFAKSINTLVDSYFGICYSVVYCSLLLIETHIASQPKSFLLKILLI